MTVAGCPRWKWFNGIALCLFFFAALQWVVELGLRVTRLSADTVLFDHFGRVIVVAAMTFALSVVAARYAVRHLPNWVALVCGIVGVAVLTLSFLPEFQIVAVRLNPNPMAWVVFALMVSATVYIMLRFIRSRLS